jgi:hypothetical protein
VSEIERAQRWRLILGDEAKELGGAALGADMAARDRVLDYLYGREYGAGRNRLQGGLGESALTVPEWIDDVHRLFPAKTIERLERDALERYGISEMVTNVELLKRAQPSMTLLKAVLQTKHLMNQEVLNQARLLVSKVVEELMKKLARRVETPFLGTRNRQKRSYLKVAKNFDPRRTIALNLKHYDPVSRRMAIQDPYFNSRARSQADKWQIVILVDESGSMMDSVIHSAVTAAIFWGIKSIKTRLVLFDTSVVDVTDHCSDPVETLMKVQLGGGTDIALALAYAAKVIENPRKTILVLISDFCEGGDPGLMFAQAKALIESGVRFLGLAALDSGANPSYDRHAAETLVALGAEVGAMTPGELAQWVGERVR